VENQDCLKFQVGEGYVICLGEEDFRFVILAVRKNDMSVQISATVNSFAITWTFSQCIPDLPITDLTPNGQKALKRFFGKKISHEIKRLIDLPTLINTQENLKYHTQGCIIIIHPFLPKNKVINLL